MQAPCLKGKHTLMDKLMTQQKVLWVMALLSRIIGHIFTDFPVLTQIRLHLDGRKDEILNDFYTRRASGVSHLHFAGVRFFAINISNINIKTNRFPRTLPVVKAGFLSCTCIVQRIHFCLFTQGPTGLPGVSGEKVRSPFHDLFMCCPRKKKIT